MDLAFYNDNDPYCCRWLESLISAGVLPNGVVDCRPIQKIKPIELAPYTQVHLFAGMGGWPYALALAGWPASRRVWTGSCPCQPFSVAGKREGTRDKRHLWPVMRNLIRDAAITKPATIFGEQVASKAGREWFSGVRVDLEKLGYETGCADLCAAGVGAPHIRQRLYWVAQRKGQRCGESGTLNGRGTGGSETEGWPARFGLRGNVDGLAQRTGAGLPQRQNENGLRELPATERDCAISGVGVAQRDPGEPGRLATQPPKSSQPENGRAHAKSG